MALEQRVAELEAANGQLESRVADLDRQLTSQAGAAASAAAAAEQRIAEVGSTLPELAIEQ